MEEYLVPTQDAAASFTEKRSKFTGRIWVTQTEEEAIARIKQMREAYWDATHNVYAYIIHGGAMRYSDDGEPQGTAGMPVLEVLRRENLYNVCCVVTRYFGGVLLGAGGLVRAYTKSAKLAVDAAGISQMRLWQTVTIPCPYALYERVCKEAAGCGGQVADAQFGADVQMQVLLPLEQTEKFLARLVELSSGRVTGTISGESYRAFPVEAPKEPEPLGG